MPGEAILTREGRAEQAGENVAIDVSEGEANLIRVLDWVRFEGE